MKTMFGAAALLMALAACSTTGATKALKADIDAGQVNANWNVRCLDDQYKATRTCQASTFGDGRATFNYFQIAYVNGVGPMLVTPNDFPGRVPTVRVDNGPVLSEANKIVTAMRLGKTAYVSFHVWPTGEQRMTVDVTGFSEAYDRLLELARPQ